MNASTAQALTENAAGFMTRYVMDNSTIDPSNGNLLMETSFVATEMYKVYTKSFKELYTDNV